jgi:quinol monooxygenase YgiN
VATPRDAPPPAAPSAAVVVTGAVVARPDTLDELLRLSLEHVHRSRREPGCLSHGVHQDVEDPLRLVFVERWVDRAHLDAHFRVPASLDFVRAAASLAAVPPTMTISTADG